MEGINKLLNDIIVITNDIYNSIGAGYNEVIYHRAFEVALRLNGISYNSEVITPIMYKGHNIGHGRVDLIINNIMIIELKAIANLNNNDSIIQIKNYMKQHNISDGLIINFGQCNKTTNGSISIKYINDRNQIFNFVNGQFVEFNIINII
jgi:GxxExxY protein